MSHVEVEEATAAQQPETQAEVVELPGGEIEASSETTVGKEILISPAITNKSQALQGVEGSHELVTPVPEHEASTPRAPEAPAKEGFLKRLFKKRKKADKSEKKQQKAEKKSMTRKTHTATGAEASEGHKKVDLSSNVLSPEERIKYVLSELSCDMNGLTTQQAEERLAIYGANELPMHEPSKLLRFLLFFWNPLAWAMEVGAIVAVILQDYVDFGLILGLLVFNACLGFWEETTSGNAIKALEGQLTPTCKVKRDGEVKKMQSSMLVPGDVVLVRLGDIVPADCIILPTDEYLKLDQSALTGESLPVTRRYGDEIYSGTIVKQGEVYALVIATGPDTYFGKAAGLIDTDETTESHVYRILRLIGWFCIILIIIAVTVMLLVDFVGRSAPCTSVGECPPLENALVVIVGGVPIAMPTVLSVTMATGAFRLAQKKAIVARLTAVEELAGMDILCSDKTGTLTKNKLTLADPITYENYTKEDVMLYAALCSLKETGDAIDVALVDSLSEEQQARVALYRRLSFRPFDPVSKKTVARLLTPDGEDLWIEKGAPQVILDNAANKEAISMHVSDDIDEFASRGYRCLGVSRSSNGTEWTMIGLIPLFDPPRDDTKDTIDKLTRLGVSVKMITGDQVAIAKETARSIGLGDNIISAKMKGEQAFTEQTIIETDGFAQVFPEHKYAIVKALVDTKHTVGMTGDGVNDAPALKKANIGIAVEGATDAARAAADIVLVSPGLSVICDAIIGARKIFQRMKNYAMYSITSTVRIILTFSILTVSFGWYFPAIAIVFLAILNDISMITISRDRVVPSPTPDKWDLVEIFGVALVLGAWLTASTITLWVITIYTSFWTYFGLANLNGTTIRGLIYYQVSISGLATLFVTRTHSFFWKERAPSIWVLSAFIVSQTVGAVLAAVGLDGFPNDGFVDWEGSGWGYILVAWAWAILWFLPMDFLKIGTRWALKRRRRLKGFTTFLLAIWYKSIQCFRKRKEPPSRRPSLRPTETVVEV